MTSSPKTRLNYVELSVGNSEQSREFFEAALGWKFTEFGPAYCATTTDDTDIGLDALASCAPLPIIETSDINASLKMVEQAGGKVVKPVFAFPGGQRFHFTDPDGNELAIWQRQED